jgi:hypothetical protein
VGGRARVAEATQPGYKLSELAFKVVAVLFMKVSPGEDKGRKGAC